ncbi:hypothetical protein PI126_g21411, partial [Phytophthora idaei]
MFILSRYLRASNGANIYSGRCMEDGMRSFLMRSIRFVSAAGR